MSKKYYDAASLPDKVNIKLNQDLNLQFNVVMVNPETEERMLYTTDSLRDAVVKSSDNYDHFVPECIRIYDFKGKFLAVFDKPDIFALKCAREYLK